MQQQLKKKETLPPSMLGRRKSDEEAKTFRVTIRFTKEQMERVKKRAATLNISTAEYCRSLCLNEPPPDKSAETREFMRIVCKEANNINRITREMHTCGLTGELLSQLETITKKIFQL